MARTFWLALALAATTTATTAAAVKSPDAPADESFGPFKYTAISVRTKIDALGRSYTSRWADDASLVHDAGLVESSYRVWAQRYPKDHWLPPTAFHLAQLYQEIQTQEAHDHAVALFRYVAQTFPKTKEAHFSRVRLAQGLPALHAESPVSPTPAPYGSPTASAAPASSAVPGASAGPTASTAPAAAAGSAAPAGPASSAKPGAAAAPASARSAVPAPVATH